ncbi:MAG: sporulation integral membrane protein YlbJ [Desulforudis sp.]|jgi:sporulation integral membrane protein YlbJ|nr:MAG: sporulation integral membrane protein YlbJ [Desulforudis sp.]
MPSTRLRFVFTGLTIILTALMVTHPKVVFGGAVLGLDTWWNIVFPSLLPFFIISELLLGLGLVHAIGILLEPVMRPLFRLPGAASFGLAVGYSSGYPIGGSIAARLRADGLCTRSEAEHLVSFTNNSSPLFMLVAVSVGMLHNPALGPFILGVHYVSNLVVGICFRFYAPFERSRPTTQVRLWQLSYHKFLAFNEKHPGQIMGDAVRSAINKLLVVGGFIILFAVLISLLRETQCLSLLATLIGIIVAPLGLSPELYEPLAAGLFEMTIGVRLVAESGVPLLHQLIAIQLILAWSGLSIQAQVAAFIGSTDIRFTPYLISRLVHMVLAAVLTILLFPPFEANLTMTTFSPSGILEPSWFQYFKVSTILALVLPFSLACLGMLVFTTRRLFHSL